MNNQDNRQTILRIVGIMLFGLLLAALAMLYLDNNYVFEFPVRETDLQVYSNKPCQKLTFKNYTLPTLKLPEHFVKESSELVQGLYEYSQLKKKEEVEYKELMQVNVQLGNCSNLIRQTKQEIQRAKIDLELLRRNFVNPKNEQILFENLKLIKILEELDEQRRNHTLTTNKIKALEQQNNQSLTPEEAKAKHDQKEKELRLLEPKIKEAEFQLKELQEKNITNIQQQQTIKHNLTIIDQQLQELTSLLNYVQSLNVPDDQIIFHVFSQLEEILTQRIANLKNLMSETNPDKKIQNQNIYKEATDKLNHLRQRRDQAFQKIDIQCHYRNCYDIQIKTLTKSQIKNIIFKHREQVDTWKQELQSLSDMGIQSEIKQKQLQLNDLRYQHILLTQMLYDLQQQQQKSDLAQQREIQIRELNDILHDIIKTKYELDESSKAQEQYMNTLKEQVAEEEKQRSQTIKKLEQQLASNDKFLPDVITGCLKCKKTLDERLKKIETKSRLQDQLKARLNREIDLLKKGIQQSQDKIPVFTFDKLPNPSPIEEPNEQQTSLVEVITSDL